MNLLDPEIAHRLTKLLGMLGSSHDGERASAALKANELVLRHGLTWGDVIPPRSSTSTSSVEEMIAYAMRHGAGQLDAWEAGFLRGIQGRQFLTAKQLAKLAEIVASVRHAGGTRHD